MRGEGQQAVGEKWQPVVPSHAPASPGARFDETRGNWYYKREYYRKARQLNEAIHHKINELAELKNSLFKKRTASDKAVADFNNTLGFEEGELDEVLKELAVQLSQEREEMIELTEEERKIDQELKEKRNALEQLKTDMTTVGELDQALDKSMGLVLENISKARSYEEKAWKDYNGISQTLSDRKAEQLYLNMQTYMKNIENISQYLTGLLSNFINTKTHELSSLMDKIRREVERLRAKGIELSKKIATEKKADMERKAAELKRKMQEEEEARKKREANVPWWQRLRASVSSAFQKLFGKKKEATPKETPKKATKPVAKTP